MDQFLVAMCAVAGFAIFVGVLLVRETRRSNRIDREPTESDGWLR